MKILVLHGPNLNLLGAREPEVYGSTTQEDIIEELGYSGDFDIELFQSNHEGELIDALHGAAGEGFEGIIFNPGAYSHYSYALYDAVRAITLPVVEVHLSDITAREDFRAVSVIAPACIAQFYGNKIESYKQALKRLSRG